MFHFCFSHIRYQEFEIVFFLLIHQRGKTSICKYLYDTLDNRILPQVWFRCWQASNRKYINNPTTTYQLYWYVFPLSIVINTMKVSYRSSLQTCNRYMNNIFLSAFVKWRFLSTLLKQVRIRDMTINKKNIKCYTDNSVRSSCKRRKLF